MSSGNMQYLMKFATAIAAVLVCICAITVVTSAQPGVCYRFTSRTYSQRYSQITFHSVGVGYSYGCGWWGRRCRGTRYHRQTRTSYAYRTQISYGRAFDCCAGYQRAGSKCWPICTSSCVNGTCIAPDRCDCDPGWTGRRCTIAICIPSCVNGNCIVPDRCDCDPGWTGQRCRIDINECIVNNGGCQHMCNDTEGSFECYCRDGYSLNPNKFLCDDINECESNNGCQHICMNTNGSFECLCRDGYSLNADGFTCDDIDECEVANGGCDHSCNNTEGSFSCDCNDGYQLRSNGLNCDDIDECVSGTHNCSGLAQCENFVSGFRCSCPDGYDINADFASCVDRDECFENISGCNQVCNNTVGSYFCSCLQGYMLGEDGRNCVDIDECAVGNGGCEHQCINTPGGFNCQCFAGHTLELDGFGCRALQCPQLNGPQNGTIQCSGEEVGNRCTFTCDAGFKLAGSAQRLCLPSVEWSGSLTSCEPLLCEPLEPPENGVILVPCNSEYTSSCTIQCKIGFNITGKEPFLQTCIFNPDTRMVEWTVAPMCIESNICEPNPCQHGGNCSVDSEDFVCNCEGTDYRGPTCNIGIIDTPEIATLMENKSEIFEIHASPDHNLTITMDGGDLQVLPATVTITSNTTTANFQLMGKKPGQFTLKYRLGGPSADSFEIPENNAILVRERGSGSSSTNQYFTAIRTRAGFLNESCCSLESSLPIIKCPMTTDSIEFKSTCEWSEQGRSYSTAGIVFSSYKDLSLPLSISGVTVNVSHQSLTTDLSNIPISDCSPCSENMEREIDISITSSGVPEEYVNCYYYDFDFTDLNEILGSYGLVLTYFNRIQPLLPNWLRIQPHVGGRRSGVYGINSYIAKVMQLDEVKETEGCKDVDVTAPGLYSVLRYEAPILTATIGRNRFRPYIPVPSDPPICFAINLCESIQSPVFIGLPPTSKVQNLVKSPRFVRQYLNGENDFTIYSATVYHSPQMYVVSDMYWNGINHYQPNPQQFDLILKSDVSLGFSSGSLQVKLQFSGKLYVFFSQPQVRNAVFTGEVNLVSTHIGSEATSLMLTDNSEFEPSILFTSGIQNICEQLPDGDFGENIPSGISLKLVYQPRVGQEFFSRLFSLGDETLQCPIDVFINLDDIEMKGMSLYTECPHLNLERLRFTNMAHRLYFVGSEGYQYFCLPPDVSMTDAQPLILIRSSLQTNRLQLGRFMTLLPGTDSVALSVRFGQRPLTFNARMHSVNISLFDAFFNTPVDINDTTIHFTTETEIFRAYPIQLRVSASTDRPWNRLSLTVKAKFSDTPGGFQSTIESYVQQFLNDTLNQAKQREMNAQMALERSCGISENRQQDYIDREMILREADVAYDEAVMQFNAANASLLAAQSVFDNANQDLQIAQQNLQSICDENECEDETVCEATSEICYFRDVIVEQQHVCSTFKETISYFPEVIYGTRIEWEGVQFCRRHCRRVCFIFFSIITHCYRDCHRVYFSFQKTYAYTVWKPRVVLQEELEPCIRKHLNRTISVPCNVSSCRQQPNIRCIQNCRNQQRRGIQSLQQTSNSISEPFRIVDEARRNLSIAQVELERNRARRDNAQQMFNQILPALESAQISKNLSEKNLQDVLASIQREISITERLKDSFSENIFKIKNISFELILTTQSPVRIPLLFVYEIPFLQQSFEENLVFDFSIPEEISFREIAARVLQTMYELFSPDTKRSAKFAPKFKRQQMDTNSNVAKFQRNCVDVQNLRMYFSDLASSLNELLKRIEMAQQSLSENEAALKELIEINTTKYDSLVNFDILQNVFNVSSDEVDSSPPMDDTMEAYSSLLEEYLTISSNRSKMVGRTTFSEWQASMEILHNETQSAAGYPCFGFVDCLDTALQALNQLLRDMPAFQAHEFIQQFNELKGNVLKLATDMNLSVPDALQQLNPVINLLGADTLSSYWCSSPPNVTEHPPLNVSIPVDGVLVLTCSAQSQLPILYQWRRNGNLIPNSENNTLVIKNIQRQDSGNYTCHISNSVATVKTTTTSVFVYELPVFYLQPTSINVYAGDRDGALFTCNATAWPFPGWRWYFRPTIDSPWVLIEGEDTNELLISAPQKSSEGWYTCEAFNDFGFISAEGAYLNVLSISVSQLGVHVSFQLARQNSTGVCRRMDVLEAALYMLISQEMDLKSSTVNNLTVQDSANSNVLSVTMTLISQNVTTERILTLTLQEIENIALPTRSDFINARQSLQSIFEEDGFTVGCDNLDYKALPNSLTFQQLTYFCPPGQGLHSNFLLCVTCSPGTYEISTRQSRIFNGEGLVEQLPSCQPCEVGSYEPRVGSTECLSCPDFHRTNATGATSITQCFIEPLLLDCNSNGTATHISIDCQTNRPPMYVFCAFDGGPQHTCRLPIEVNARASTIGNHSVVIEAVDGIGLKATKTIHYFLNDSKTRVLPKVPPMEIHFINGSPRIYMHSIEAEFTLTRPAQSVICQVLQEEKNCSSGRVNFTNLESGSYVLKIIASNSNVDKATARRRFEINTDPAFCTLHLINRGVTINGNRATVEFIGTEPAETFLCKVDDQEPFICGSPVELSGLSTGTHRMKIVPRNCGKNRQQHAVSFTIIIPNDN